MERLEVQVWGHPHYLNVSSSRVPSHPTHVRGKTRDGTPPEGPGVDGAKEDEGRNSARGTGCGRNKVKRFRYHDLHMSLMHLLKWSRYR